MKKNEIEYLVSSIQEWMESNQKSSNTVEFFGSFCVTDPKNKRVTLDQRVFVYGNKKELLKSLERMARKIVNEDKEFINW